MSSSASSPKKSARLATKGKSSNDGAEQQGVDDSLDGIN